MEFSLIVSLRKQKRCTNEKTALHYKKMKHITLIFPENPRKDIANMETVIFFLIIAAIFRFRINQPKPVPIRLDDTRRRRRR
jgi:hypothetical protein